MTVEIVVGIDFGTTHTGVSWTYNPATAQEIFMVNSWVDPRMRNANHDKVPSEICYDRDGNPSLWGFEARSDRQLAVRWFKVLMDEEHMQDGLEKEVILNKTKEQLASIHKTANDVVVDYLRCVWKFSLDTISATHKIDIKDQYRFRVVITVPAIWNPEAMERTRQAIQMVIENDDWPVEVVQEPTAGAIYTLNHLMKYEPHAVRVGDCYLVCDAGGGTVDLIAYEVKKLNPLQIKPILPADGSVCGSILLDRGFHGQMRQRIGPEIFDSLPGWRIERLMKSFEEQIKMGFEYKACGRESYRVELGGIPDGAGIDVDEQLVQLQRNELRAVFDPVCAEVWKLISDHNVQVDFIGKKIKTVLVVGGFGMSNYLEGFIKAKCGDEVKVVRPRNSVTAVCRGATMWGVERSNASMNLSHRFAVSSMISTCSYGVVDTDPDPWDPEVHTGLANWTDPVTGELVVKNQMKWLLRYGDHIYPERGETITLSKYVHVEHKLEAFKFLPGDVKFKTALYYCRRPEVPIQLSDGVLEICTVSVTLKGRHVKKRSKMIISESDGKKMYKVSYDLRLELGNNNLTFKLHHEHRERGSVRVTLGRDGQPRRPQLQRPVSGSKVVGNGGSSTTGRTVKYLALNPG